MRRWIVDACVETRGSGQIVRAHFVACASRTASAEVEAWGVDSDARLFEFWNWVGGRVLVGVVEAGRAAAGARARIDGGARTFLDGARAMDEHFFAEPLGGASERARGHGALGIWNVNFLGLGARAVVPYSEALARFAAHVQQLEWSRTASP